MKKTSTIKFKTVEDYLATLPTNLKEILISVRDTIKKAAPQAEELISYNMPAFQLHGMLVWYAAYRKHIGFYPRVSAIDHFKQELSKYEGAKGSVKFPIDKSLPFDLITKIVKFRAKENLEQAKNKALELKKTTKSKKN